jgi:hypothetical protein
VGELREAISAGRARHDGQTQLVGRTVERIRMDPPPHCPLRAPGCREPSYAYVDPESYDLVQWESPNSYLFVRGTRLPVAEFKVVFRYLTFEYLPRTAANLALTDIVAQHPDAGGPFSKKRPGG